MHKSMLGKLPLSEVQGPRDDLESKLAGGEGEVWLTEFKKFLRREPCWLCGLPPIEFVSAIVVPAATSNFLARKKFVVNTTLNRSPKISLVSTVFAQWFLSGEGKVEIGVTQQILRCGRLRKESVLQSITVELGGVEKAETTLSGMFFLLENQKHGGDGILANDGRVNMFYVRDLFGDIRLVTCRWWCILVIELHKPYCCQS
jgi:hypothetical protein